MSLDIIFPCLQPAWLFIQFSFSLLILTLHFPCKISDRPSNLQPDPFPSPCNRSGTGPHRALAEAQPLCRQGGDTGEKAARVTEQRPVGPSLKTRETISDTIPHNKQHPRLFPYRGSYFSLSWRRAGTLGRPARGSARRRHRGERRRLLEAHCPASPRSFPGGLSSAHPSSDDFASPRSRPC